jgi:hypothetical protein
VQVAGSIRAAVFARGDHVFSLEKFRELARIFIADLPRFFHRAHLLPGMFMQYGFNGF